MVAQPATFKTTNRTGKLTVLRRYQNVLNPLTMIFGLMLIMFFLGPARFFRLSNMWIILRSASIYMVLGMGMTIVMTGGGIDLSVGSLAALSAVLMAGLHMKYGVNIYVAMLLAIFIGILGGLLNSLIITKLKVPDLICTLATDLVFRGFALVYAAGAVLHGFPEIIVWIGAGSVGNIPALVIIGVTVIVIGYLIYHYTTLGRYAIAIGGNREAAILTGIAVNRHKMYHYMLMGALATLSGIMLTGRLNAIQAVSGAGFALHTIAAVVVGGTNLFGGRGSMGGTLVGAILLAMIVNMLVILRIPYFWQQVASGVIIVSSVALYTYLRKRA